MLTILIAAGAAVLYLIAYHTYGKFLASKLFVLDDSKQTPAYELRDNVDYCPANKEVLFGHHFTSIAGTGPIVGPAIAVIWGWVPALIWVLVGSILMGAVHDFGALALSAKYKGRSIGDLANEVINPRVRLIFLFIIFFALVIVLAIFGMVIAVLFKLYPASVFPVWIQIPIALFIGYQVYHKAWKALPLSLAGVALLYLAIIFGNSFPISVVNDSVSNHKSIMMLIGAGDNSAQIFSLPSFGWINPVAFWTIILMIYAYIASVLPVWRLLQPRDYLNSHQLFIALGLLAFGILITRPEIVAPAERINDDLGENALPIWPFLFITIACGAVSGFHCMVGSGTTSKQLKKHSDALTIGYGSMLLEGMLAVLVILACVAGVGLSINGSTGGEAAWLARYQNWDAANGLPAKVGAFVDGSANIVSLIMGQEIAKNILPYATTLMAVFVVCFAATTLDTATRLQRYVISEIAKAFRIAPLASKHGATSFAVITALIIALTDFSGKGELGKGGLILWPLFGATNQLLACLALLVITVWLKRSSKPIVYTLIPMIFMMFMTGWSMIYLLDGFYQSESQMHLFVIGSIIVALELWMIVESFLIFFQAPEFESDSLGEEA